MFYDSDEIDEKQKTYFVYATYISEIEIDPVGLETYLSAPGVKQTFGRPPAFLSRLIWFYPRSGPGAS